MASYLYNTQLQSLILNIIFIIHHPRLHDINTRGGPCPLPFAVLCFSDTTRFSYIFILGLSICTPAC